jgi:multisubunit Na+/H+ antiporter MnhG subunit
MSYVAFLAAKAAVMIPSLLIATALFSLSTYGVVVLKESLLRFNMWIYGLLSLGFLVLAVIMITSEKIDAELALPFISLFLSLLGMVISRNLWKGRCDHDNNNDKQPHA